MPDLAAGRSVLISPAVYISHRACVMRGSPGPTFGHFPDFQWPELVWRSHRFSCVGWIRL